jgi:four helix bundle protein
MYLESYKQLKVWQKSVDLIKEIYILTQNFPKEENYGLSIQMRRAAISIPSNIAEGQRRKDLPEFIQFLRIADASSAELETQIIISKQLYVKLNYSKVDGLLEETQKMLNVMIRRLKDNNLKAKSYKLKTNEGELLIEAGIAISILVVGLLGILSLLSRSLSLNNIVSSKYIASNLAAEGIEVVKNLIDANIIQFKPWNTGLANGSYELSYDGLVLNPNQNRNLLFDESNNTYNYQNGELTPYKREIEIIDRGDEIQVNSIVTWQIRGGSYSVNLEDHFFNWRQ